MAYTVAQLIARATYLSGKRSEELQNVTGQDVSSGLVLLNSVLAIKSANKRLIPYFTKYDFNAVIGQEQYFIPNLIDVETFVFFLDGVRFSTEYQNRTQYFGSARANNISSLPYAWHYERCKGGSNFFMYFQPDQNYPLEIWGKFSLSNVVLSQDLSATLDDFYIEYLRYALAEMICQDANIVFQPQNVEKLKEYEKLITDVSPPDLTVQKVSAYNKQPTLTFAQVNLGGGFVPPSF